jgi:protein SCO1/2
MKTRLVTAIAAAVVSAQAALATDPATPQSRADDPHAGHHVLPAGKPVPGESLYQLDTVLTLADGSEMPLRSLRGKPVLITMFYSSCDGVCPLLAFTMRRIVAAAPEPQRSRLVVLMVSFDPARDTPAALREFGRLNNLRAPSGLVARARDKDVRELAAVLGVRYRELPNGIFSHSAVISLLDEEGVIRAQTTRLQEVDPAILAAISSR